ncbi:uncharacterized protein LOC122016192 isoform X1 [Zingiber officinale]|uniref:H15 domain-containing protein n=2 Tax=Zingiber officinale TaxID=94328 RepID=A0A8J5F6W1_ZINOF|nr:uncharacterized protein LOC122016192 isoform X1 [Zingiber officinale]KAG6480749.1 hypothetical protein ZIOFF_057334 [Zingiber officinale]
MAAAIIPSNHCIPDHPPYALMIAAAIHHFAEEDGSTEAAISDYIRANYDGLPWAHDRLLPYYLGKLTRMGEFAQGAPGRYVTVHDDQASPQPPSKQPHGPASMALCPHQAVVASALPQLLPPFIPKRLGRPPKRSGVGNPSIDRQCGSEPAMPPPLVVIENGDNNCGGSLKRKRRGRPPKRERIIDAGAVARTSYDHGQSRTELIPLPMTRDDKILVQYDKHSDEKLEFILALPCYEASISTISIRGEVQRDEAEPVSPAMIRGNTGDNGFAVPKRRGRGRPPKSGRSEEQEIPIACIGTHAVAIIPAAVPVVVEQLPASMHKRRGRPPKKCGCCNDTHKEPKSTQLLPEPDPRSTKQLPPPSVSKRRGRPPKSRSRVCNDTGHTGPKQALASQTTEVNSVCGDGSSAVRKCCGRPPKRRNINDTTQDADHHGRQGQAPATVDIDASVVVPIRKAPTLRKAWSVKRLECVLALPRQEPLRTATVVGTSQGLSSMTDE